MGIKYATYVLAVCKMGQGASCCRYLMFSPDEGFQCAKMHSALTQTAEEKIEGKTHLRTAKELIDAMVFAGRWHSKADNCEGKDPIPDEAPADKPF